MDHHNLTVSHFMGNRIGLKTVKIKLLTANINPCNVGIRSINAVNTVSCFSLTYSRTEIKEHNHA